MDDLDALSINAYELKAVSIGDETVYARPVAWDQEDEDGFGNSKTGEPISAITWETVCPTCGQLLHFNASHVFSGNLVVCNVCGAGAEAAEKFGDMKECQDLLSEPEEVKTEAMAAMNTETMLFCNPIAEGRIKLDINKETMDLLDAT